MEYEDYGTQERLPTLLYLLYSRLSSGDDCHNAENAEGRDDDEDDDDDGVDVLTPTISSALSWQSFHPAQHRQRVPTHSLSCTLHDAIGGWGAWRL